jgi:hypothetical protein
LQSRSRVFISRFNMRLANQATVVQVDSGGVWSNICCWCVGTHEWLCSNARLAPRTTANNVESIYTRYARKSAETPKFVTTSGMNVGMSILKDRAFVKMFSHGVQSHSRVPATVCAGSCSCCPTKIRTFIMRSRWPCLPCVTV